VFTINFSAFLSHSNVPTYAKDALAFCNRWQKGQKYFTFHTSGSTGTPKSIIISRKKMEASALATNTYLGLTQHHHFLLCLSAQTIAGAMLLVRAMQLGATCTIMKPTMQPLAKLPNDHPFTIASFVPSQLVAMQSNNKHTTAVFARFQTVLVGGAPIAHQLDLSLSMQPVAVYHTYGMTETVSHIALRKLASQTSYICLPQVRVKLNIEGCLCIQAPSTGNRWITTNDMAQIHNDGTFSILGRTDEVINSGGIKINTLAVESIISDTLNINREVVVLGVPDEVLGQKIVAVIESDFYPTEAQLLMLKKKLPLYHMPKEWVCLPKFLYTQSGKLDRQAIVKWLINREK
jgi:O-succinylbenzoic acid--CoA ligase